MSPQAMKKAVAKLNAKAAEPGGRGWIATLVGETGALPGALEITDRSGRVLMRVSAHDYLEMMRGR